jgi:Fic-DOC domain mobile mystery protein B
MAAHEILEDGQTPLDPDEAEGLIPRWVATRGDLDAVESANITHAYRWAGNALRRGEPVAHEAFLRGLHKAMFGQVWRWAGRYRQTERNIGIAPHQICMQVAQLFDDTAAWRRHGTYPLEEQAWRLHHRLAWIHPFPNGNGRCSRLMADYYLVQHGLPRFSWGSTLAPDTVRADYIEAIRAADHGDFAPLAAFVRR